MVRITNNWIIVDDNKSLDVSNLKLELTVKSNNRIYGRNGKVYGSADKHEHLYFAKDGKLYIPRGLLFLIEDFLQESKIEDFQNKTALSNNTIDFSKDEIKSCLSEITLSDEQYVAVRKILYAKRCLVQMSTGSGKTEVMCAVIKLLERYLGKTPTTLILEPSTRLVVGTIERLEKYGIDCLSYNRVRKIEDNIVTVAHPRSLGNDLSKDPNILENVSVLFGDESHHLSSPSFRKPTYNMSNLEMAVGLSASAISNDHIQGTKIKDFSMKELLILGSTGKLVLNVTAEHFINKGILAKPVLIRINNPANESLEGHEQNDWHAVRDLKLESDKRVRLVSYVAKFFSDKNRKVLILVNTISWAEKIMKILNEYNLSSVSRCSYGGNVFMKWEDNKCVQTNEDVFKKYSEGSIKILIGTTHIYEGVDIPSLDTIILAYGGKGERLQVQGIGRALRKTKSGKYAYLVDFTDHEDVVLSKHSKLRMTRYKELIGVPDSMTFDFVETKDLDRIFSSLEDN